MLNNALDLLNDYPFDRLRVLLNGITPPAGPPLVMSIGEPQHSPPSFVQSVLEANGNLWGRYPPTNGTPEFRAAAVNWLTRRFSLPTTMLNADRDVLPVAGTREALYMIAQVAIPQARGSHRPAVLIPNPFYQVYLGAALMNGGEPVFLSAPHSEVAAATLERTALAYLCTPANPQGTVADLETLKQAILLARQYGYVLAVDECYSEIYDGAPPAGTLQACAELGGALDNVIVFHSLSKRSSVPGLRSGFVAGDPRIIAAFARLRAYGGAVTPLPILAAAATLWQDEAHVVENRTLYQAKMTVAQSLLEGRFGFSKPAGSFFLWLDVGNGEAAAQKLWGKAGIRVLPGAYLAHTDETGVNPGTPFIRVALVHDIETTTTALHRLRAIL